MSTVVRESAPRDGLAVNERLCAVLLLPDASALGLVALEKVILIWSRRVSWNNQRDDRYPLIGRAASSSGVRGRESRAHALVLCLGRCARKNEKAVCGCGRGRGRRRRVGCCEKAAVGARWAAGRGSEGMEPRDAAPSPVGRCCC